jgi:hypothetical protein
MAALFLAVTMAPAMAVERLEDSTSANPAPNLHRNPFERPVLVKPESVAAMKSEQAPPPWTPELRATLLAGDGLSLANVDGEMVEIGEDYQGHTLVEVREREAVFERGGKRWVLSLD